MEKWWKTILLSHKACVYGPAAQQTVDWKIPSISIHWFMWFVYIAQIGMNDKMPLCWHVTEEGNIQAIEFSDMFVLACFVNSSYQKHLIFLGHCEFVTVVDPKFEHCSPLSPNHTSANGVVSLSSSPCFRAQGVSVQRKLHHMVDVLRRTQQNGRMELVFVFWSSPSIFVGENGRPGKMIAAAWMSWQRRSMHVGCKKGTSGSTQKKAGRKH